MKRAITYFMLLIAVANALADVNVSGKVIAFVSTNKLWKLVRGEFKTQIDYIYVHSIRGCQICCKKYRERQRMC